MNIQSSFTVYTAALHALILILFSLHTSGLGYPGLTWLYCISTNKSFSSPKTSSTTPYSNSKQQEKQKQGAENTINFSQDAVVTTPGGDEYVVTDTNAPNSPCHVPVPDGVSECGLSELPSSIHSDDETEHDAFFVQTCVEEVENAEYVAPLKPLLSMRV